MKERWIPETPGGSVLMDLSAKTETQAWLNLRKATMHMPYKTADDLKARGYKVQKWTEQ